MISVLVAALLAQPSARVPEYLPPDEALERVLPQPWREVVSAPHSVTLEGLVPLKNRSREVKGRWRRSLDADPESVSGLQKVLVDGASYAIPGPGWGSLKLCGVPIPELRVTLTRGRQVVTAEICFGCSTLWLRFDENGRRVRDDSFDLAREGWLEVFAPLVPDDDFVAQRKRRQDERTERAARRTIDGGVP
jgi:hypothetical protein